MRDKDGAVRKQVKDLVEKHGGRFRTPSLRLPQDDVVIQLVHVGDAGNEKALHAAKARGEKVSIPSMHRLPHSLCNCSSAYGFNGHWIEQCLPGLELSAISWFLALLHERLLIDEDHGPSFDWEMVTTSC